MEELFQFQFIKTCNYGHWDIFAVIYDELIPSVKLIGDMYWESIPLYDLFL